MFSALDCEFQKDELLHDKNTEHINFDKILEDEIKRLSDEANKSIKYRGF